MTIKQERKLAFQEFSKQLPALRAKWPKAFTAKSHEIRPLVMGVFPQILIDEFGWSRPYAAAIILCWKLRPDYCRAVLEYPKRINLDGSESDQETGEKARIDATCRLAEIAAKSAKPARKRERGESESLAPKPAPALTAEPEPLAPPEPTPASTAEPDKPRKLVLAGSAAMQAALARRLAPQVVAVIPAPAPRASR